MLYAGDVLLQGIQETPTMNEYVKRSNNITGPFFFIFLIVSFLIFFSLLFFFFYTLAQILPTLAVVADPDQLTYTQVPLSDLFSDVPPSLSLSQAPQVFQASQSSFFHLGFAVRPILSHLLSLRTHSKPFSIFRGFRVFALISVFEALIAALSSNFLPCFLAILLQVLLPLTLVQLYALWTHTVLTYPSTKSFWQRMPPFKATLRATGPALALFLSAKALLRFTLVSVLEVDKFKWRGALDPWLIGALILAGAGIEVIALVPTHMVLTRTQASLLPADENTIIPIDEALMGDRKGGESEAVGMKEAWRTFGWGGWRRLVVLYVQVFVLVLFGGGAVLAAGFVFYIMVALMAL